ncbi:MULTISPECIES: LysR substrate-binding domain-containing protein [unclassified Enterobacter]|uniref:LysR substrate-binding domain-containing protein n=1 Tax=unclassified Enterobacter TaxID=2608935 RepID=UPI0010CA3EEB|nr:MULTISPECIES: LysR substrate-binding domain-containing protein [unclassified Enterobacter]UAN24680.1 LysR family transcriptional regulator [Enterobacter sp. JBIWA003]UAN34213.1 LysR family transcriptional regulator [Enterobacter sp. JBIWA005]BBJ69876.1 transcriptional regulator [Enterobacter sp. 18A13]
MKSKLPPLTALRAFVALARLGSVGAVADELHVTHSAISHQMHALENYLGISLVNRTGRRTILTDEGRVYAYQISQALENIVSATEHLRYQVGSQYLRISVLPSFAMHWLVPRLSDWLACNPTITLNLEASTDLTDFDTGPADCAIRFGHGEWPNMHIHRLMGDSLLLVAAPRLFSTGGLQTVEEVLAFPRLQATESWSTWLSGRTEACTFDALPPSLLFSDSTHMLEAARTGMGIALTRRSIASGLLERGELVQVTAIEATHTFSYYLVWPHRSHNWGTLERFSKWLDDQAKNFVDHFTAAND